MAAATYEASRMTGLQAPEVPPRAGQVAIVALPDPVQRAAVVARLTLDGVRVAVIGDHAAGAEFVLQPGDDTSAVKRVEHELGSLTLLVCAAPSPSPAPFAGADPVAWLARVEESMSVPLRLMRAAAPALRRAGDSRIVLVGRGWGAAATAEDTAAAAVQGAMVAFTKTLARDLGPHGVVVNEIATSPETNPGHLASAVAYLAAPGGGAMVGQVLTLGRGGEVRP